MTTQRKETISKKPDFCDNICDNKYKSTKISIDIINLQEKKNNAASVALSQLSYGPVSSFTLNSFVLQALSNMILVCAESTINKKINICDNIVITNKRPMHVP